MRIAFRLAVGSAIGFALISAGIAGFYYWHARPMLLQPEKYRFIEQMLRDPTTTGEMLRQTALEGHNVILSSHAIIDSALELLICLGYGAALVFAILAYLVRKAEKGTLSAP